MTKVLGVSIYSENIVSAVATICSSQSDPENRKPKLISATSAHGLVEAAKDITYKQLLNNFYWNLPDGMPVTWVAKLKGAKKIQRCYGPDFFAATISATKNLPLEHFFCGGKPGVADQLAEACQIKFGNHQIAGTYSPPFREMTDSEMEQLGQQIIRSGAHIVWIGLSTPKQEKFAERLCHYLSGGYIITVGAAFDFHTGQVKQAPKWIQKIGMEWFFRLLVEPKRLYRRYLEIVPKFIWLNFKEFIDFYIYKKGHI